jgi:hypothetical protein
MASLLIGVVVVVVLAGALAGASYLTAILEDERNQRKNER